MAKKQIQLNQKEFLIKVIRNGFILAGLYLVSVFSVADLNFETIKPVLVFLFTYILTELGKFYGLDLKNLPKNKRGETLIF